MSMCASLDQPARNVSRLWQILSANERMRTDGLCFEQDRKHFIVSHGILKTILGCYAGIEPSRLAFSYGPYGKPALARTPKTAGIQFNMSHSKGLVLYAVTRGPSIGIALEYVHPMAEIDQVAEHSFSAQEKAIFVCSKIPPQRLQCKVKLHKE